MSAPLGRQTQGREPRVSFESLESDRKKDVVSKTSRWSSAIEAALHESNPCFSSLSISQSSLASTSQLRFKEFDATFDIQLKFQSSSCLPVNTCFSLRYLWCDSQSYLHIIPSHFESSLSLFSEEDLPISFGNLTSPLYRTTSHTHRHPAETSVAVHVSHRFWGCSHKDALSEKIKLQAQLKLTLVHLWRNLENSRIQHCHTL